MYKKLQLQLIAFNVMRIVCIWQHLLGDFVGLGSGSKYAIVGILGRAKG